MKSNSEWNSGGNGSKSSGFTGLPGGFRDYSVGFLYDGSYGYWWSASEAESFSWGRLLNIDDDSVYRGILGRTDGLGTSESLRLSIATH